MFRCLCLKFFGTWRGVEEVRKNKKSSNDQSFRRWARPVPPVREGCKKGEPKMSLTPQSQNRESIFTVNRETKATELSENRSKQGRGRPLESPPGNFANSRASDTLGRHMSEKGEEPP